MAALGAVAPPLLAIGAAAIAAGASLKAFDTALAPLVDRFSKYSAAITGAEAQADLRRELNDMRRAEQAGPRFAEYLNAQSQMSETWEDIKTTIMNSLAPIMTTLAEIFKLLAPLAYVVAGPLMLIGEIIDLIRQALKFLKIIASKDEAADAFDFNALRDILIPSGGGV
jgi:DNA-binding transcriptional regulator YiaG